MAKDTRMKATVKKTVQLRDYVIQHPDATQDEVLHAMGMKGPVPLYNLLMGAADDAALCAKGVFNILHQGQRLTLDYIEDYLDHQQDPPGRPPMAERLIYLYNDLQTANLHGGISLERLLRNYCSLLEDYTHDLPKPASIKRSLQRDLNKLETYGINIMRPSTGSKNKTYRLEQEYLPKLSLENAAMLYVSTMLHRNTLMNDAITSVRRNIESGFFQGMPERSRLLRERIYILGDTLSNPEQFGDILGSLVRAVSETYRVKVEYINNDGKTSSRILEPLGMVCKRSVWYLIARQVDIQETRTFRVDQVCHLTNLPEEPFAYPTGFLLPEYIGNSWGVFCNDPVRIVRLRFSPQVARRVKNLCYHPSQRIVQEDADGSIVIRFEVCGLLEMRSWIMQWGSQVEVLEPLDLRKQIREMAENIIKTYQGTNV